jgi:transcriptional accessory protein Tex/SPT6
MACEAGLQPLADLLWQRCTSDAASGGNGAKERNGGGSIRHEAKRFVDGAAVPSVDDALAGARDILAGEGV